jgi:hypothetical protein
MSDTHRYKMVCRVGNAAQQDVDRWLANYCKGRFATLPHGSLLHGTTINVYLDAEEDRIALREAFDVAKVEFTT